MFQITLPFLYAIAAVAFALSRFPQHAKRAGILVIASLILVTIGVHAHLRLLLTAVAPGGTLALTLGGAVSLIGLQLATIALLAAVERSLRGLSAGLLLLAALAALAVVPEAGPSEGAALTWQMQTHVLLSMFAYGLLTAGAIVGLYALIQDRRLRAAKISAMNHLFAPLEMTERVLYGVTTAGFALLALSVVSGFSFVEDLFAQHLAHKTVLSLLALAVFGVLVAGRYIAGWRGRAAVYLYLGGFLLLLLAYFGTRFILEEVLNRSWS